MASLFARGVFGGGDGYVPFCDFMSVSNYLGFDCIAAGIALVVGIVTNESLCASVDITGSFLCLNNNYVMVSGGVDFDNGLFESYDLTYRAESAFGKTCLHTGSGDFGNDFVIVTESINYGGLNYYCRAGVTVSSVFVSDLGACGRDGLGIDNVYMVCGINRNFSVRNESLFTNGTYGSVGKTLRNAGSFIACYGEVGVTQRRGNLFRLLDNRATYCAVLTANRSCLSTGCRKRGGVNNVVRFHLDCGGGDDIGAANCADRTRGVTLGGTGGFNGCDFTGGMTVGSKRLTHLEYFSTAVTLLVAGIASLKTGGIIVVYDSVFCVLAGFLNLGRSKGDRSRYEGVDASCEKRNHEDEK